MKQNWPQIRLGDIAKIITGKTPRTNNPNNYGGVIPFLTPSDDLNVKHVIKTSKTITSEELSEVKTCLIPANSICVSCIGSDLGKVVMTTELTITNQQINSIIPSENFDSNFMYYSMIRLGKEINYISKTSTAVPIVNKSSFSNYCIPLPPLSTQRAISAILSCLDDKIELNNQTNTNLEAQAQAIFKSWFVDFEPFQGGKFVDSALGKIPVGWKVGRLSEIADFRNGLAMQKYRPNQGENGLPVLKIKELRQGICDSSSELCSENVDDIYVIEDGDVIFSWSGSLLVDL
jgi:type I restriction enzyme S subunit